MIIDDIKIGIVYPDLGVKHITYPDAVEKHYAGKHDQSTHGNWATDNLWHGEVADYTEWKAWQESSRAGEMSSALRAKIEREAKKLKLTQETMHSVQGDWDRTWDMREQWQESLRQSFQDNQNASSQWENEKFDFVDSQADSDIEYFRTEGKVTIAIDGKSFERVLNSDGFLNQFDTRTSNGLLNSVVRTVSELRGQSIPFSVDNKQRPIYGYVAEDDSSAIATSALEQYGDYRVVLKDSVRDRTTMTIGDSMNTGARPIPMFGKTTSRARFNSFGKFSGTPDPPLRGFIASDFEPTQLSGYGELYAEAQIFGGVKLSDIARVVWTDTGKTLSPRIRKRLADLKIPLEEL